MQRGGPMQRSQVLRSASVFFLVVSLFTCLPVLAQTVTGDITGDVTDSSGAVLAYVTVRAVNRDTNCLPSRQACSEIPAEGFLPSASTERGPLPTIILSMASTTMIATTAIRRSIRLVFWVFPPSHFRRTQLRS